MQPPQPGREVERPDLLGLVPTRQHRHEVVLPPGVLGQPQVQPVPGPGQTSRHRQPRDRRHHHERQQHGFQADQHRPERHEPEHVRHQPDQRPHRRPWPVACRGRRPLQPVEERRRLERLQVDRRRHVEHLAQGGMGHLGAQRLLGQPLDAAHQLQGRRQRRQHDQRGHQRRCRPPVARDRQHLGQRIPPGQQLRGRARRQQHLQPRREGEPSRRHPPQEPGRVPHQPRQSAQRLAGVEARQPHLRPVQRRHARCGRLLHGSDGTPGVRQLSGSGFDAGVAGVSWVVGRDERSFASAPRRGPSRGGS